MASEYTYSPRMDFFIERVDRATGFEMPCFHIHHKYEIYYEIEGTSPLFYRGRRLYRQCRQRGADRRQPNP